MIAALLLVVSGAAVTAQAAEQQYANGTLRSDSVVAASSVVTTHTGGHGWVSGTAPGLFIHIQLRSATNYGVVAEAVGDHGGPVTLSATMANTWSTCMWHFATAGTNDQLRLYCWRTY